jgi:hypothetical protein
MTKESRIALWLDDQLGGYQERLLRRQQAIFDKAGVEVLPAPDLVTFVRHLSARHDRIANVIGIDYLVIDLMVPQMSAVRDFSALGIATTLIEEYVFGLQLATILFSSEPKYPDHRSAWNDGLLTALRDVPTCILSTNERGEANFAQFRLPEEKKIEFFWKDAGDAVLDGSFGAWVRRRPPRV